jgi:hypothetical protein
METRNSRFEDHINIVESSHQKTAGLQISNNDLLKKLSRELGLSKVAEGTGITAPGAPTAEGEVSPAASSVAGAAPTVAAATEAVAMPQVAIAGGNPAEMAAGEVPAAIKPNEGLAISDGTGLVTDANNWSRTPEAVAAAALGAGGDEGAGAVVAPEKAGQTLDNAIGAEKATEAEKIGQLIARSFQRELEKQAQNNDYVQALEILKEAQLLDGYQIKDTGMSKTAGLASDGYLEKIASGKALTKTDIIGAAVELIELEKQAAAAEEQGRQDARELVQFVSGIEKQAEANAAKNTAAQAAASTESEKVASYLRDPEVVKAVKLLTAKGVI